MPTATPTPPGGDPFALLNENSTFADLMTALPPEAVSCIETRLGAGYQAFLNEPLFVDGKLNFGRVPADCLDHRSAVSVGIVALSHLANGLSEPTVSCIRTQLASVDVAAINQMIAVASGDATDVDSLRAVFEVLACINEEEMARISASGALSGIAEEYGVTPQQLHCVLQTVPPVELATAIETMEAGGTPDFVLLAKVLQAFEACGVDPSAIR